MIDKGLTYAYAEGGPVASEGRPRPNPFVRPMPNGKPVYNNITVDGFVGGPAVLPQQPVFGRRDHLGMPVFDRRDHLDGPDRNQRHPRPILYFGPDGQPVYDNITVGGAAVMPEAIRRAVSNLDPEAAARAERIWASSIDPGGDFGLPPPVQETPVSGGIFGSLPVADPVAPPPRTYSPDVSSASPFVRPTYTPLNYGLDPSLSPYVPPSYTPYPIYQPPPLPQQSAADTRAAGYNATMERFANSPFVRPEGIGSLASPFVRPTLATAIGGLQLGKMKL